MQFTVACLALSLASANAPASYPAAQLLVEPAEVAKPENAEKFLILDARERKKYDAGHIPGAHWVDHADWAKNFGDGSNVVGWSRRLLEAGIGQQRPIVIYDDNKSKDAARIWWILRYWDFADARILNGGWVGWQAAGMPTSTENALPNNAGEIILRPRSERLADKDQMLELAKGNAASQVIDARSEGEFCGAEKMAKRGGAVPGAKHLEWCDLLDAKTQRFKSTDELKRLFLEAGIDPAKPSVTYCQSGGRASVMAFALELMGAKDVRNYYASWAEWGNADDTPVEAGKARESKK
jgi:thiosulfate/3-mercaptopyruvate sulfurtransferase